MGSPILVTTTALPLLVTAAVKSARPSTWALTVPELFVSPDRLSGSVKTEPARAPCSTCGATSLRTSPAAIPPGIVTAGACAT